MAQIFKTADGSESLVSDTFGVSYHSKHGAVQETQHVFLDAGLAAKVNANAPVSLSILELGFGTGLNALMTQLFAEDKALPLHYTTLEAYPITEAVYSVLSYPSFLGIPREQFLALHECEWNKECELSPHFTFLKKKEKFEAIEEKNIYDLVYFDAFAPTAQAHLWEIPFLEKIYASMRSDALLVTYCAKGVFKRNLKAVGFEIEALPGPPGKREMTRAKKI